MGLSAYNSSPNVNTILKGFFVELHIIIIIHKYSLFKFQRTKIIFLQLLFKIFNILQLTKIVEPPRLRNLFYLHFWLNSGPTRFGSARLLVRLFAVTKI